MRKFLKDESGAVVADYIVLGAAIVGTGLSASSSVHQGVSALGNNLRDTLSRVYVAGSEVASFGFDDVAGLTPTGWGWVTHHNYQGWSTVGHVTGIEIKPSGGSGVHTPDGRHMLDLDASPGNLGLARTLNQLTPGQTYTISFNAADVVGNNGIDIMFGGQTIAQANPVGATMQSFSFNFVAGSGDGSNQLIIQGTGPADNVGAYIHGIRIH